MTHLTAKLHTVINYSTRLLKKCWMPLAILLITMAILFSLFRALTPWAKQYKGEVEHHLSTILGQPVSISSMETSWYWFEPVLKLNQVSVLDNKDRVLKLSKLLVGINLFSSLWHWHIQPGILYIDDVHLTLRQLDDRWQIDGLQQDQQTTTLEADAYLPILAWLLNQERIVIKNASALVHLKDGSLLPLSHLNLIAVNYSGRYRLKGEAKLAQTTPTELLVLADMKLNPYALNKTSGHAYVSLKRFLPRQWQLFFPSSHYKIEGGKGRLDVWLDLAKGHISNLQTKLKFRRLVWSQDDGNQSQFIQAISANLAWLPQSNGWTLSGDEIKLRAAGVQWPENSFQVKYQSAEQIYDMFINTILIEPLLATAIQWPEIMQPVLALQPKGELKDTQIKFKSEQIDYVLTRFTNVSWHAKGSWPKVDNISGALSWQPSEGRLEFDGTNTTIAPKDASPITFTELNGAFEWKELSHGLRISMPRLVLNHPNFLFSARGALDEPFSPARNLRLTAEFSAENAAQWLPYIPSSYVKAKLNDWLKGDIKRIDKASGQLTINGALADFPFDNQPGEFSIISQLTGVDLSFNKKWPLVRDIDAYLHIDKRLLDVDVSHALFNKLELSGINLRMYDMGLGKETLLIHGNGAFPFSQLKSYIFASPLKQHFAKLKQLAIDGLLGFDLNLEVPLYPENDDILVRGAFVLNNNHATFHHALKNIDVEDLSGSLRFDEHGVIDSSLSARLLGDPVAMHIQSKPKPQPHTEIKIEGDTTIELLREKFSLPILPFIEGHLKIISQIMLTDDPNDLDNIKISSSLHGVSIDLPAPLGKTAAENTPLSVKIDFNPEKGVRLRGNYANRLSTDIWFASKKDGFVLDNGEIKIGGGEALWGKRPGLQVVGALPALKVEEWQDVATRIPAENASPNLIEHINGVDMKFGELSLWGRHYQHIAIKASKVNQDTWSFDIDQSEMAGSLRYEIGLNTLSGHFNHLYLPKLELKRADAGSSTLNPSDIPNLDLTIGTLKLGEIDVGNVALKSMSTKTNWHLEYCKIISPEYQLTMKGDWKQTNGKNTTELQTDLQVKRLAKGLERWQITPVVDARQGIVQFKGGWPGAINQFSLAKLNGNAFIMFQHGQITHLSPETEEKLGLGKLLSVLSLQTIPRRLTLDFSDLSNPGYSFDTFKGNFAIKNGVMSTSDSYIDGPVAYASMKGDLDVARQIYDVELHVSPHITASLPIVATIAGGPIAGMAAWVASKIINQGMQQVTGYTYKISGPWLDPVVQQVSIYKKAKK